MRLGGAVLGVFLVLGCGGPSTTAPPPANHPPADRFAQLQAEQVREACDPEVIARAEESWLRFQPIATACPAQQPRYEARLVALLEAEVTRVVSGPPCPRYQVWTGAWESSWQPSEEMLRKHATLLARIQRRCVDWVAAQVRASGYRVTPEIMAASAGYPGRMLDCELALEMYDHVTTNPAATEEVKKLADALGMPFLSGYLLVPGAWFTTNEKKPIKIETPASALTRTELAASARALCSFGMRSELAKSIAGITHRSAPPVPGSPPVATLAPLPAITIPPVPECGRSSPLTPTTVHFAVKECATLKVERTHGVEGYVGTCRDGVNRCYYGPATVTRDEYHRVATVTITIWVDGVQLASRTFSGNADGVTGAGALSRHWAEGMLAEARDKREYQRRLEQQEIEARQRDIDGEAARAARIPVARREFDAAQTPEAREEAAADYILSGGRDRAVLDEVARLYRIQPQPRDWPWSQAR